MNRKKTKKFDCVAFKRDVQTKIYEETKHLSPQEEIAYFRERGKSGGLAAWWATIRSRSSVVTHRKGASRPTAV
jgi:hypothetical protein